jgi:hypothetical protein
MVVFLVGSLYLASQSPLSLRREKSDSSNKTVIQKQTIVFVFYFFSLSEGLNSGSCAF